MIEMVQDEWNIESGMKVVQLMRVNNIRDIWCFTGDLE